MRTHLSSVRPTSLLLAFALASSLLVLTPEPARAHDSCVMARPAATGAVWTVLSAVNVFSSLVDTTTADCPDKYEDAVGIPDREWGIADASRIDPTTNTFARAEDGKVAQTFAACEDGMAAGMFPCDGIDMLSQVSLNELAGLPEGSTGAPLLNDIWGWTDPETGKEFALVGTRGGTSFVDVTDPIAPIVYGQLPTASTSGGSSWRDLKVYADHVFVVSEHNNHGVQVFDLTRLRDWNGEYTTYDVDARYTQHGSAHNIVINEDTGYAYSVGAAGFSSQPLPHTVTVADGAAAGGYLANGASFGPSPTVDGFGDTPMEVVASSANGDFPAAPPQQGCDELEGFTAGNIAIAYRGSCAFSIKAANAQNAGAVALIVVNSGPGSPINMGGTAPEGVDLTIPSVMVSDVDGATIVAGLPASADITANDPEPPCGNGLHMINVQDPKNPAFAGCYQDHGYVHDAQCVVYDGPDAAYTGREICINSNGISYTGQPGFNFLSIVDVTDKTNPVEISRVEYDGRGYSHQGWLTEDHAWFLHGDEGDEQIQEIGTTTRVWDLSDLDAPFVQNVFQNGETSIDHNIYTEGSYANAANYTTGFRLFDLAQIDDGGAVSEIAFFDTYPENDDATFEGGPWSNYPYFEQPGVVAVSAIDRGLFMLRARTQGAVTMEATTPEATEAEDGAFTVTIDEATRTDVVVEYTVAGDAVPGTHYTELPGSVTIPEGETSATVPIEVISDRGAPVDVVLTLAEGPDYTLGQTADTSDTVTIEWSRVVNPPTDPTDPPTDPTDPPTDPTDPPTDPGEDGDADGDGIPDDIGTQDVIDVIADIIAQLGGGDSFDELDETQLSIVIARLMELLGGASFAQADDADVLIASSEVFADALASGTLQAGGRPLLLNGPDALDPQVLEELQRTDAASVTILGGTDAISQAVEDALVAEGIAVERIAGATRFETATAIAETAGVDVEGLLARAFPVEGGDATQAFADSLAAGGWAADGGIGLVLSQSEVLTDSTASFLEASAIEQLTGIGGTAALAEDVLSSASSLGITTERISGATRFATATAIAEARGFTADAPAERVIVIEGQAASAWSAGFVSAALSAVLDAPILLVNGDDVPAETEAFLTDAFAPTDAGAAVTCIASPTACDAVATIAGLDA